MELKCKQCGIQCVRRRDALFCSDSCRSTYHTKKLKANNPEEYKRRRIEYARRQRGKSRERNLKRSIDRYNYKELKKSCYFCNTTENLQFHHFDYLKDEIPLVLCSQCHARLEYLIKLGKLGKAFIDKG